MITISSALVGMGGSTLAANGDLSASGGVVLTVVPESATTATLLSGLGMLTGLRRFRRRETDAV